MENASKALLIAGAVLIAILLISVGIMIYSGASGIFSQGSSAMSDAQKQTFNQKFRNYEGIITGGELKELVALVNANNIDTESMAISWVSSSVNLNGRNITDGAQIPEGTIQELRVPFYCAIGCSTAGISDMKNYEIRVTDQSGDGVVDVIVITPI